MADSGIRELFAPEYDRLSFDQIFTDAVEFKTKLRATGLISDLTITDTFLTTLFYMLYANHGNDPIVSTNSDQWVFRVALTTQAHAPTYLKKLDIQSQLRALSLDDLREGYKNIFNHAMNPSTTPSTENTEELPYVNDQNVNKGKSDKANALAKLWDMLHTNTTDEFLRKYDKLFSRVATTTNRMVYFTNN